MEHQICIFFWKRETLLISRKIHQDDTSSWNFPDLCSNCTQLKTVLDVLLRYVQCRSALKRRGLRRLKASMVTWELSLSTLQISTWIGGPRSKGKEKEKKERERKKESSIDYLKEKVQFTPLSYSQSLDNPLNYNSIYPLNCAIQFILPHNRIYLFYFSIRKLNFNFKFCR